MGIGDWGLGIGPNPQSPSPIPNHINKSLYLYNSNKKVNINKNNYFEKNNKNIYDIKKTDKIIEDINDDNDLFSFENQCI